MGRHRNWKTEPMNAATVQTAASLSRALEDRTVLARGLDNLNDARAIIARETKVPASTLANLRREPPRLKERAADWVTRQLASYYVRTLEEEMARSEHELSIVRRMAERPDENEIFAAEASVVAARTAIKRIAAR